MKDDGSYILHFILIYNGLWVCDTVERGMERVHYEFHYELLGFKKDRGKRGSLVPYKTNCKP